MQQITGLASTLTIGGTRGSADKRNVISGNTGAGLELFGATTGDIVEGNGIEIATGQIHRQKHPGSRSNDRQSHHVEPSNASGFIIGGLNQVNSDGTVTRTAGNVISGNLSAGMVLNGASDNLVEGNLVGTDWTGIVCGAC